MNKEELLDQLHKTSALIMKAKIEGKSQLVYKNKFAELTKQYKRIWLKENYG